MVFCPFCISDDLCFRVQTIVHCLAPDTMDVQGSGRGGGTPRCLDVNSAQPQTAVLQVFKSGVSVMTSLQHTDFIQSVQVSLCNQWSPIQLSIERWRSICRCGSRLWNARYFAFRTICGFQCFDPDQPNRFFVFTPTTGDPHRQIAKTERNQDPPPPKLFREFGCSCGTQVRVCVSDRTVPGVGGFHD